MRRIASNYLFTGTKLVKDPLVTVAADGRIVAVDRCDAPDRLARTEFYAGMLLPGMVNAHCHLELSYLHGAIAEGGGFTAFARGMREVRERCGAQEKIAAIAAADARMWADGIRAVGDIANGETASAVKSRSRITYRTFNEVFGLHTTSFEPLAHPTPHATYSLPDAIFREICATGDDTLSIHFMESPAEGELFERRGELWDWYRQSGATCDFLHYGSPARRLVESIPADRSVILVHNCCVTQREIDLIMGHFTAPVRWCLCPGSNRYISRLRPPVELLRKNGLNICLGTDSLASNRSLSLLDEMRLLPEVPLVELLQWATLGGARALGLDRDSGLVEAGKHPGLCLLSGLDYDTLSITPSSRIARIF